jgi:hypothetical protein
MFRSLAMAAVALSMAMFVSASQAADKKADTTHSGTVVSAGSGKLVMTGKDKKEHSHDVGTTAKVTIDGKAGKLDDLKKGATVTVTTDKDGKVTAVSTGESKPAKQPTKSAAVKPAAKAAAKTATKAAK